MKKKKKPEDPHASFSLPRLAEGLFVYFRTATSHSCEKQYFLFRRLSENCVRDQCLMRDSRETETSDPLGGSVFSRPQGVAYMF